MTKDNRLISKTEQAPRGTRKSIADKLRQFRRESVDDGVLTKIKQKIQDNDSGLVEKIKSPLGSPDEQLNTRRHRSGRKQKSSPFKLKRIRLRLMKQNQVIKSCFGNQIVPDALFIGCTQWRLTLKVSCLLFSTFNTLLYVTYFYERCCGDWKLNHH